jgi:tetratricopeptide (TPR) repeat protein/anti-sigma regulatory factor (Ser/Thr protein kinase)
MPCHTKGMSVASFQNDTLFKQILINARGAVLTNPDSADKILNQLSGIVKTSTNKSFKASYNHCKGLINRMKSNMSQALPFNLEAYKLYSELNDSTNANAELSDIGSCYMIMAQYVQAKYYLTKSLKYAESRNDSITITNACLSLTFIHIDNNEYGIAEDYLRKAILYAKTNSQNARAYNNLSEIYLKNKEFDKAIENYKKALAFSDKANDQLMVSLILCNIGYTYMNQLKSDSALFYFKKVISRNKSVVDNYLLATTYANLANLELKINNQSVAKYYIQESLKIAIQNNISKIVADNYTWLSRWYANQNDYKNAYEFKSKATEINDSLFNQAKSKQINEFEAVYQSEAKQSKINLLDAQNTANQLRLRNDMVLIVSLTLVAILILLFSVLLFRQHKLKANTESQALGHKLLRTQMNPHFIFNSLVAIQSFLNKQSPEIVSGYIGKFSRLMRLILENSRCNLISIENEVETLQLYLEMQKMRFSNSFSYSINLPEVPEFLDLEIPPMIAQPFVENAIEHGFLRTERGGTIIINYTKDNNYICCEVEDNGVGIEQSSISAKANDHKSLAMEITSERLALISKKSKLKASFTIEDLSNVGKTGTLVKIKIPLKIKI